MPETLEQAIELHRAGRLAAAEAAYRAILSADAANGAACHWLGMLCHEAGRLDDARCLVRRSVELAPDVAEFRNNFATVLGRVGRHEEALEHLRVATRLRPDYLDAWHNTGAALEYLGEFEKALLAYDRALAIRPPPPPPPPPDDSHSVLQTIRDWISYFKGPSRDSGGDSPSNPLSPFGGLR